MTEGEIILVSIQQADGKRKNRPAIYLREIRPYGDLLVCGISTQLRQEVPGFDEIIGPDAADFVPKGTFSSFAHPFRLLSNRPKQSCPGYYRFDCE